MSAKKIVLRSALSFDVEDGLLDIDQIMSTDAWSEIDEFVQRNFMQDILNEFNEVMTLDPERVPEEKTKKKQRTVQSRKTTEKKEETFVEKKENNSKASTAEKLKVKIEKSKDKIEKSKDKIEKPKDNIEKPKDKIENSKDKIEKSKDKIEKSKDKIEKPKDKIEKSKDKIEKSKDKIEKSSTGKKKSEKKRGEGSKKSEKKKSAAEVRNGKKEAGKSAKDRKSQGNSSGAKSLTVEMSNDETKVCETRSRAAIVAKMAETMERTNEMETSLDINGYWFEASRPRGESSRIDELTMERDSVETFDDSKSNENDYVTIAGCPNVSEVSSRTISNEGENTREKSLRRSRHECSREGRNLLENSVEKEILQDHRQFGERKKRRTQSLGKSRHSKDSSVEDISKIDGGKREGRKSSGRSKCSKEKENVEQIVEGNVSKNREETEEEKKRGRKSLRRSKCLQEETLVENQILDGEEDCGGENKVKKSLGTSKSKKENENAEKIMEKNIPNEITGGKEKNSSGISKYSEQEQNPLGTENLKNREELDGGNIAKRWSVDASKCSKQKENAEKMVEKNISTSHEEKKTARKSFGTLKCSEERNPSQILEDHEKFDVEKKPKSLRTSMCSKEDAAKIVQKNIAISQEQTDAEKKRARSFGNSKCSEERNPSGQQILEDREKFDTEEKPKGLRASVCSKEDAAKIVQKNIAISQEQTDAEKKRARSFGNSKCSEERNPSGQQILEDREKFDTEKKPKSLRTSMCSKEDAAKIVQKNIAIGHKETSGEEKWKSLESSKYCKEEKKILENCEGFDVEKKAKRKSKGSREKYPARKAKDIKTKEKKSKGSRVEKYPARKEKDAKTKEKKPKPKEKRDDKSAAIKDPKVGRFERLLLEKKQKREARKIRRHERKAERAMAKFSKHVASVAQKMGYLQGIESSSSDSSDSSSSYSDDSDDSSEFSDSSCCSNSSCSCCTYDSSGSCSDSYSCSCSDCSCSDSDSSLDSSDSSDEYSEFTVSSD